MSTRAPGGGGSGMLAVMLSLPRRLLVAVGLIALLFLACGLLYLALQLHNPWWLLGAVVAFGLLAALWVMTLVAMRRAVGRRRREGAAHAGEPWGSGR